MQLAEIEAKAASHRSWDECSQCDLNYKGAAIGLRSISFLTQHIVTPESSSRSMEPQHLAFGAFAPRWLILR